LNEVRPEAQIQRVKEQRRVNSHGTCNSHRLAATLPDVVEKLAFAPIEADEELFVESLEFSIRVLEHEEENKGVGLLSALETNL
jgi:hypothetical protein